MKTCREDSLEEINNQGELTVRGMVVGSADIRVRVHKNGGSIFYEFVEILDKQPKNVVELETIK